MSAPSRRIDQIESREGGQDAHADCEGKGPPRMRDQLTVKYAAIVGLSLQIVTACLDVLIVRCHIALSFSSRFALW
jgi:hypothetical protein